MTSHYIRTELLRRETPATTAACGTVAGSKATDDPAEVTCKRCLKTIETGSAATGKLAGR